MCSLFFLLFFFFFKQKTAYEMRISDWSSDVCSSDLQYGHYMHMLNVAMTRGAQQEGRPLPTLADWFGLLDAQTRNARAWQRLFAHYDPVIAPAWGTPAFPHDHTPNPERRLDVDTSEEHTAVLQSLMRISYAVFCFKK